MGKLEDEPLPESAFGETLRPVFAAFFLGCSNGSSTIRLLFELFEGLLVCPILLISFSLVASGVAKGD